MENECGETITINSELPAHLNPKEIHFLMKMAAKGANAVQLHRSLAVRWARSGVPAPNVTNIRKLVKGRTYNRGSVDRCGRPWKLTHSNAMIWNRAGKLKLKKANGSTKSHGIASFELLVYQSIQNLCQRGNEGGHDLLWKHLGYTPNGHQLKIS